MLNNLMLTNFYQDDVGKKATSIALDWGLNSGLNSQQNQQNMPQSGNNAMVKDPNGAFYGMSKPGADGKSTVVFSGMDNSVQAQFAKNHAQKWGMNLPAEAFAKPYMQQGTFKDGVFSFERNGKQMTVAENVLRTARGAQLAQAMGVNSIEQLPGMTAMVGQNPAAGGTTQGQSTANPAPTNAAAVPMQPSAQIVNPQDDSSQAVPRTSSQQAQATPQFSEQPIKLGQKSNQNAGEIGAAQQLSPELLQSTAHFWHQLLQRMKSGDAASN